MRTHKPRPCPAGFSLRAEPAVGVPVRASQSAVSQSAVCQPNGTPSRHPPPHRPASGPGGLLPVWKNQGAAVKRTWAAFHLDFIIFFIFFFYS